MVRSCSSCCILTCRVCQPVFPEFSSLTQSEAFFCSSPATPPGSSAYGFAGSHCICRPPLQSASLTCGPPAAAPAPCPAPAPPPGTAASYRPMCALCISPGSCSTSIGLPALPAVSSTPGTSQPRSPGHSQPCSGPPARPQPAFPANCCSATPRLSLSPAQHTR